MRIVIMGTGPFAVPTAQRILDLGHSIPIVVTPQVVDAKAKKQPSRPVADWESQHRIAFFEPASINTPDSIEFLKSLTADLLFVCDYGQILNTACLSAAPLGGINLHGSLLPRHRGAAPVQWALLAGDAVAGVTVIHMTPKLDAGPALAVRSLQIMPDETAGELEPRLADIGVAATEESLRALAAWDGCSPIGEVQDRSLVTRAPRFTKQHGQLDFRLPAEYLVRLLRACQPWPGTFADLNWPNGKSLRLLVRAARAIANQPSGAKPGSVAEVSDTQLGVGWSGAWKKMIAVETGHGSFLISRLQPAGKREMDVAEFLRGHPLQTGTYFSLPEPNCSMLEASSC